MLKLKCSCREMMELTIIVTVKQNSQFLYRTLMNLKDLSNRRNYSTEVICILNHDDVKSNHLAKKASTFIKNLKIVKSNKFDFWQTKNSLAKKAKGKYLLFIDSGNFLSSNFIKELEKQIKNDKKSADKTIFVPEVKIFFGNQLFMERNLSTDDYRFFKSIFLFENPWGNNFIIRKEDFCRILFSKPDFENKLNPHVLSFYCDCIDSGYKIKTISQTVSFIRTTDYDDPEQRFTLPDKSIFDKKATNFGDESQSLKHEIPQKERQVQRQRFLPYKKVNEFFHKISKEDDNRNILKRIFSAMFPQLYLKLYIIKKKFTKSTDEIKYPDWLVHEWKKVNILEPELFPPSYNIQEKQITINQNLDSYLEKVLSSFPKKIDYLFFCPWLKIGGADKVALNLMNALKEISPNKSIGVITTENVNSELLDKLPANIHYFDFGNSFLDLTTYEREALFLRAIIQIKPQKIININSHKLFSLLLQYSKTISSFSEIFCFAFCVYITKDGQIRGFAVEHIPLIVDNVKMVITDNKHIIDYLCKNFGLDANKFQVIYSPVSTENFMYRKIKRGEPIDILWSSRIDDQKLPYVLESIIRESQGSNYRFHIHGSQEINYSYDMNRFKKYKNVFVYGSYKNGLASIDHANYDIFLYTSKFDGMPNVLLEALSLGLPVVASDTGGINEIIKDGKTGFLVKDIYNPKEYLEKINKLANKYSILKEIELNSKRAIEKQHSWDSYLKEVKKVFI